MTPSEFKAWFEGFTESMDGPPSLKQWERIQVRVKQITGTPTTYPVYVDRYVPRPLYPWYHNSAGIAYLSANAATTANAVILNARCGDTSLGANGYMAKSDGDSGAVFDSHAAMNALGKADAADLKAA